MIMQDLNQQHLKDALKSQYHASLDMLGETIEKCPEELWTGRKFANAFWQVAYHTLFFTHLYLSPGNEEFIPWAKHRKDNQNPDCIPGDPDPKSDLPLIPDPYSKEEVLEYLEFCKRIVDEYVDKMDLTRPDSGFYWYPMSKLEHQLVNLRHLQHGAAQLADRLRQSEDIGIRWVGRRKK
jgi:hypothetical protein